MLRMEIALFLVLSFVAGISPVIVTSLKLGVATPGKRAGSQ